MKKPSDKAVKKALRALKLPLKLENALFDIHSTLQAAYMDAILDLRAQVAKLKKELRDSKRGKK